MKLLQNTPIEVSTIGNREVLVKRETDPCPSREEGTMHLPI